MPEISAYILSYNEEAKIEDAVKSVAWADEVLVVDSNSTDSTVRIAESLGASVVTVPFDGFGRLRNSAIAACSHDWIFSLDADERCTPETAREIRSVTEKDDTFDAYYLPRRNWFMGRWIKHSGWYPDYRQPQLFRKGALIFDEEDEVHEGYSVNGSAGYLKNPIWQLPFRNLEQLLHKINRYSSLGSEKLNRKGVKGSMIKALSHGIAAFIQPYIMKLGFLDGWAGFVIALSNSEVTFYRYSKSTEKQLRWDMAPGKDDFK